MAIDWDSKRGEILARLNIEQEYLQMGIQFKGDIQPSGWRACLNPYKPEKNASAGISFSSDGRRGYLVTFNGAGGIRNAFSFFDVARDFNREIAGFEFKEIFQYYAKKTGVEISDETKKPPQSSNVSYYRDSLTREVRQYLREKRGLSDESIETYQIGWSDKRERIAYPVIDENGELVNIRYHAWKKEQKPKTLNWSGFGQRRLWGLDRLVKAPDESMVIMTEGEGDAMLLEQETGLLAVSPTNGSEAFDPDWVKYFFGKHVVLCRDCDEPGRKSVEKSILPAFRSAIRKGNVLSIRIVWLFGDSKNKDRKDFTDYIIKAGGSGEAFLKMIENATPEEFPLPTIDLPDAIRLDSFTQIDDEQFVGKRVTVDLYIHGENSEAYHAPTMIEIMECPGRKKLGCSGRSDWGWSCDEPIPIRQGDRIQLACIGASDLQLRAYLRDFVCDKGQCPTFKIENENRLTLREVYAHQVLSGTATTELVEKPIYTIGSKIYSIGQYRATGFIHTHPRHQKPTMIIDTMEAQEEDWQSFDLEQSRPLLREIQKMAVDDDILNDVIENITKIYKRFDLNLGVLLTLCSPRWIDMPGNGRIRGWISSVVIGDSGTGKSEVSEKIFNYAKVGYRVSGMTASRTGITYACEYDERRGWRIKAGALLKMSGQAMIVDEAQDLDEKDLKTMAEALDRGRLKIDRIQNKEFEAETRVFFACNPKNPKRQWDQKTMASYQYGCLSLGDIFPKMMLRRLDLVIFAATFDISDKDREFFQMNTSTNKPLLSPEHMRALIFYAWNLKPEQIIIPNESMTVLLQEASRLSLKFGGCSDLPIVYPEDFRKTFCRLCVAFAVLDLSSKNDFETITLKKDHIYFMSDWIDMFYQAKNSLLHEYSKKYEKENVLNEEERLFDKIRLHLNSKTDGYEQIGIILSELVRLDPNGWEKLSQSNIKDLIDVDRTTIFRLLRPFTRERLIKSSRGYLPTPKLFQFLNWMKINHPNFIKLEDSEDSDD